MICENEITVCTPPGGFGAPFHGKLLRNATYLCAEVTVYTRRYWTSVQAGSRIDRMVEIPLRRDILATEYALFDGHLYRIEEAQHTEDADGLPITRLSLRRMEANYDLCKPEDAAK